MPDPIEKRPRPLDRSAANIKGQTTKRVSSAPTFPARVYFIVLNDDGTELKVPHADGPPFLRVERIGDIEFTRTRNYIAPDGKTQSRVKPRGEGWCFRRPEGRWTVWARRVAE